MIRTIILLLFILFSFISYAQELSVELINQNEPLLPGKVHSLVFKIRNLSRSETIIVPEAELPQHWQLAVKPSEIVLTSNESKLYLASIYIPSFCEKGKHTIRLIIGDKTHQKKKGYEYEITVKHVRKNTLNTISSTNYTKAGDTIYSEFLLKNEGNDKEEFLLKTSLGSFINGKDTLKLLPGTSETIRVYQPTDHKQPKPSQNLIKLTAFTPKDSIQNLYAYHRTDVIPILHKNEDVWLRLPIKISGMYIARQRANDFKDGFQGDVYGKGSLNEQNTKFLEFRAVGPDRFGLTAFSQYEEYFINYGTDRFFVHLGDKVYSSSFLTEYSRYGRGVELRKNIQRFEIGGFYNKPRFFKEIKDEMNMYVKANITPKSTIRYGYLLKRMENLKESHLHYMSGETQLFKNIELQGEYAISNSNNIPSHAWQIQGQANFKKLNLNVNYINASSNFAGYFTNTRFFTSNIRYRIFPKLIISSNYRKDARNLERDTLYSAAPYSEHLQIGLSYNYLKKGTVSLFSGIQEHEDRIEPRKFFYREKFSRIEFNHEINAFGLNFQTYFAETTNFLTNSVGNSSMYTANFTFNKKGTSINIYGSYSQVNRYQTNDQKIFLYGGRISSIFSERLNASVFYQNTYSLEDYFTDRNLFEVALNYRITPRQEIDVVSRYALAQRQIENKDFSFSLRYTLHLNVPIRKIRAYGSLQGNIANSDGTKIDGLKLHLGQYTAITDGKGYFSFKNIKPDTYFLELEQESLSLNDITTIDIPQKITIAEGTNYFSFGITKAAGIKGFITLDQENTDSSNNGKQAESVILEITSENEVYRKIAEVSKPFDFTYLRPGNWQLKIYRNGLNNQYKIKTESFSFTLEPGEDKTVTVEIVKQQREIKYLQEPMKVGYNTIKH